MHLSSVIQLTSAAVSLQVALGNEVARSYQAADPTYSLMAGGTQLSFRMTDESLSNGRLGTDYDNSAKHLKQPTDSTGTAYPLPNPIPNSVSPQNVYPPNTVISQPINPSSPQQYPAYPSNPQQYPVIGIPVSPSNPQLYPASATQPVYPSNPQQYPVIGIPVSPSNSSTQPITTNNPARCKIVSTQDPTQNTVITCSDSIEANFLVLGNLDRCSITPVTTSIVNVISTLIHGSDASPQFVISINANNVNTNMCPTGNDFWSTLWSKSSIPWISAITSKQERSKQLNYSESNENWIIKFGTYAVDVHLQTTKIRIIVLDSTGDIVETYKKVKELLKHGEFDRTIFVNFRDVFHSMRRTTDRFLLKLKRLIESSSKTLAYVSSQDPGLQYLHLNHVDYIISGGAGPIVAPHPNQALQSIFHNVDMNGYRKHRYQPRIYHSLHGFVQYTFHPINDHRAVTTFGFSKDGTSQGAETKSYQFAKKGIARRFINRIGTIFT